MFWFPVKDIKIPDIFYKILKFLGPSWASIIAQKRFTRSNYLDVDSPLDLFQYEIGFVPMTNWICANVKLDLFQSRANGIDKGSWY